MKNAQITSKEKSKKRIIYELLIKSAYAAYISNLIGSPSIATTRRFNFFKNPKIGDLVLETTTMSFKNRDITQNMGYLIRIEKSPDGNSFKDKWIIKTLYDNKEFAWQNADFIRVLDVNDSFYEISNGENETK